jgi:hypothetical protein
VHSAEAAASLAQSSSVPRFVLTFLSRRPFTSSRTKAMIRGTVRLIDNWYSNYQRGRFERRSGRSACFLEPTLGTPSSKRRPHSRNSAGTKSPLGLDHTGHHSESLDRLPIGRTTHHPGSGVNRICFPIATFRSVAHLRSTQWFDPSLNLTPKAARIVTGTAYVKVAS